MVKLHQKCLFQDFGRCPKILDYTLYPKYENALPSQKALCCQKLIYIFFTEKIITTESEENS